MKKTTYKVVVLSSIIAVSASNILPIRALAAEPVVKKSIIQTNNKGQSNKYNGFSLGPQGMKKALQDTNSNALVMDLYALTILKQPMLDFNNVDLDNALKKNIVEHQKTSKVNADYWLDKLKPRIITVDQNIINFNSKFQNYYQTLIKAVNANKPNTLKSGIKKLSDKISAYKQDTDQLIKELQQFRNKLTSDTESFSADSQKVESTIAGDKAGIPYLKQQIENNNKLIDEANKYYIASTIATITGPLMIAAGAITLLATAGTLGSVVGWTLVGVGGGATVGGTYGMAKLKNEVNNAINANKEITKGISATEQQILVLDAAKVQLNYLANTISQAIDSLQNISNAWGSLSSGYKSLAENLKDVDPEDFDPDAKEFIIDDLDTAKDSWKDIEEYAENLYKSDYKFVDEKS
ncbi:HBL/NHE enterotoxin family protein [Bacillus fungorum]|uniref:HBL/NHE enterotoxin family protein n=1 Tax=Bacillus fungorum TaxID=2039284 RepID=UPI0033986740